MLRFAVWLLSAVWLASPGVLVSAPATPPGFGPLVADSPAIGRDSLYGLLPAGSLASLHVPSGLAVWDCPAGRSARSLAEEAGLFHELEPMRAAVRLATRTEPEQLLRFLLGGELAVAVYEGTASRLSDGDHAPREVLALSRTDDAGGLKLALDALLAAAAQEHDVRHQRYRELPYARVDRKLLVAAVDGVLLATSDDDLLAAALDRALLARAAPGADSTGSPAAPTAAGTTTLATFSFDAARVQRAELRSVQQQGRRLLGRRVANPLANLLFGGLTLAEGRIDGALVSRDDELSLHATLPAPPDDAPAAWFPPGTDSFRVPTTAQTIVVVSARRDLADWWRQRETLMSEDSQAGLAKADENIGVLFAGLSPAEDVFAAVAPELALVVDSQLFTGAALVPEVRLPAFCLVGRLRAAPDFADSLAVAFQSLISIMNMERAQDGRAPFVLDVQLHEGVPLRFARLAPRAADGAEALGTDPNWSPAVAVLDDWLLVGSSAEQVRRLISSIRRADAGTRDGTLGMDLDITAATGLARENRAALVAQRILEEGADPDVAARDIDSILHLLSALTRVRGEVRRAAAGLELEVAFALAPAVVPAAAKADR